MFNLALHLDHLEKYSEAEELDRATLKGRTKVLGPDHPDTLSTMSHLAADLRRQQKYSDAEELDRATLEGRKMVLGPDHCDTRDTMNSLALDLYYQEKYGEAEELARAALEGTMRLHGPDHHDTLEAIASLADTLHRQNRYDEVHELDQVILAYRKKNPRNADPFTEDSLTRTAISNRFRGLFAAAAALDAEYLEACRARFGDAHAETIAAMHNYIYDLWQQQKYSELEPHCRTALKLEKETGFWSTNMPGTARTLAEILVRKGDHISALKLYQEILDIILGGPLLTLIAFDYGELLYTQFKNINDLSYLDRAIKAFALSWQALSPETDQQHDPSSSYHKAMYRSFRLLHSRGASANHCPVTDMLESDEGNVILQDDIAVVFGSHTAFFPSNLSIVHYVDYAVINISGDNSLIQILNNAGLVSEEFQEEVRRWANVCHPKLPHLHRFATTACTFNGSPFLAFLCPLPDKAKLDTDSQLTEILEVMNLLSMEYPEIYQQLEDRQLVILSTLYHLGSELHVVSEARHNLTISLLYNSHFDHLQQCLGTLTEVRLTLYMDLLLSFLSSPQNTSSSELVSCAFGILKYLLCKSQSLSNILQIPSSYISGVSDQPITVGGCASILRASCNGISVALKVLRMNEKVSEQKLLSLLAHEALIWRFLSHPHLLPFLGYYPELGACLVTEWMSHGNLKTFLWGHKECDCEDPVQCAFIDEQRQCDHKQLTLQVARGLTYLHKIASIVHGDLRADNILIDNKCNARIADFGLASLQLCAGDKYEDNNERNSAPHGSAGTLRWLAPEYLETAMQKHLAGDIYAWGCVLLEIFTGKQPFARHENDAVIPVAINNGEKPWMLKNNVEMSEAHELGFDQEAESIAEKCWQRSPTSRPNMLSVCKVLGKAWHMKWDDPYLY